jgi:hypothetical protein
MTEKKKKQYKYFYPDQVGYRKHFRYFDLIAESTGYTPRTIREMAIGNRKMPEKVKQSFDELISKYPKTLSTPQTN